MKRTRTQRSPTADGSATGQNDRYRRAVWLVCVIYVVARVILAAWVEPAIYADSERYWRPEDPLSAFNLWTGSLAPSLLPQVIFLLPLRVAFSVQGLVAGLAWSFAAWVAFLAARPRVIGPLLGFSIMLLGLLPYNAGFDSSVLSESLSMSSSLACLTFVALWCAPVSRSTLGLSASLCVIGASASFAVSALSRPSGGLLLIPCIVAAGLLQRRSWRTPALRVGLAVVSAASLWSVAAVIHENDRAGWYAAANRLGARISPAYLAEARAAGLPYCNDLGARLLATPELSDRLNLAKSMPCPELQAWLDAGGLSVVRQVRGLPAETFSAWLSEIYPQWQPVIFREMNYPLIRWPEFLGKDFYMLNRWYYDAYTAIMLVMTGVSVLAIVVSPVSGRLRSRGVRHLSLLYLTFVVSVVAYSFVVWVLDTYETRHFLPVQAVAPVFSVTVALLMTREVEPAQH